MGNTKYEAPWLMEKMAEANVLSPTAKLIGRRRPRQNAPRSVLGRSLRRLCLFCITMVLVIPLLGCEDRKKLFSELGPALDAACRCAREPNSDKAECNRVADSLLERLGNSVEVSVAPDLPLTSTSICYKQHCVADPRDSGVCTDEEARIVSEIWLRAERRNDPEGGQREVEDAIASFPGRDVR